MKNKVVIIGCGNVGSTIAYTLLHESICQEIVLIDANQDKAMAEAMDMKTAGFFNSTRCYIHSGWYEECKDAKIIIITASARMTSDTTDRLAMLSSSKAIMKNIISSIMEHGFDGILLVISNPVDLMTYYAWKLSGLDRHKVIGSGTTLDSIRLSEYVASLFNVDPKSVSCPIIGEHGSSLVPVLSHCYVGGESLENCFLKEPQKRKTSGEFARAVIDNGVDIVKRKGNTCYGIAAVVADIVKAIFFDEKKVLMLSYALEGQYGVKDVCISLPCVLGSNGVDKALELSLSEEEEEKFLNSVDRLKSFYSSLID